MTGPQVSKRSRDAGTALLAGLIGPCPNCGNGRLQAVFDGNQTNFLCTECRACWHPERALVSSVDHATCPGCPEAGQCRPGRAVL